MRTSLDKLYGQPNEFGTIYVDQPKIDITQRNVCVRCFEPSHMDFYKEAVYFVRISVDIPISDFRTEGLIQEDTMK